MTRVDELRKLMQDEPNLTADEAATRMGVSRQRVYQLRDRAGVTFRRVYARPYAPRDTHNKRGPESRVITGGVSHPVSASVAGKIGEMLVAADLMARGYVVFFPLYTRALCDLVALDSRGKALRVEVRCGHKKQSGAVSFTRKSVKDSDIYAVVMTGEPVHYDPPLGSP